MRNKNQRLNLSKSLWVKNLSMTEKENWDVTEIEKFWLSLVYVFRGWKYPKCGDLRVTNDLKLKENTRGDISVYLTFKEQ